MAKKEQRIIFGLQCSECKSQNYISERNKLNTTEKVTLRKYCRICRKHTEHKEMKKLD
ncbi:50S ribosomal protein L33 [Candidatus Gottesmanbacteria bacterium RBG_16_43_7]|uniref:Large ribosomal subunit protein bL33 n=1 Tax=Candidatus Gottesmanbacteria bacterium RBG_16_43_7 TaxID=1798373 RepID=A0A1F5Z908_9BACT|nr:MAG: 50S ribosomal protein L33 [Candidatus Gottesmanbacteria bacterium RBG_16_43_7]